MSESTAIAREVLCAAGIERGFSEGAGRLRVLTGLDFTVREGERIAIVGASGSGKTTLLQVLGGLDAPDAGTVRVDGQDIHALGERDRCELRNRTLGFVYQFHHLLPEFSALENVAMPLLVRRMPVRQAGTAGAGGAVCEVGAPSASALRRRTPACCGGAGAGDGTPPRVGR